MKNPNSVEVDEKMEERSTFVVGLEESFVPFNLVELHEPLSSGNIDETSLRFETTDIVSSKSFQ